VNQQQEEGARTILYQIFLILKDMILLELVALNLRKKLGIYNRLLNHYIAEPLCDVNGEVLYPKGTLITKSMINDMMEQRSI
jgi:DNA-directed RNA polymerase subunit beta